MGVGGLEGNGRGKHCDNTHTHTADVSRVAQYWEKHAISASKCCDAAIRLMLNIKNA